MDFYHYRRSVSYIQFLRHSKHLFATILLLITVIDTVVYRFLRLCFYGVKSLISVPWIVHVDGDIDIRHAQLTSSLGLPINCLVEHVVSVRWWFHP